MLSNKVLKYDKRKNPPTITNVYNEISNTTNMQRPFSTQKQRNMPLDNFQSRIRSLSPFDRPMYGNMNTHQMMKAQIGKHAHVLSGTDINRIVLTNTSDGNPPRPRKKQSKSKSTKIYKF